jgi:hypothetical protein
MLLTLKVEENLENTVIMSWFTQTPKKAPIIKRTILKGTKDNSKWYSFSLRAGLTYINNWYAKTGIAVNIPVNIAVYMESSISCPGDVKTMFTPEKLKTFKENSSSF